jgi:TIR domain
MPLLFSLASRRTPKRILKGMTDQARQALFISHANPEDNAFTLWLGAKLAALGYEVFADVLRLKGGDDWERILENAIREKAAKFLLVATPHGVQKQGVRNEITIATQTAKRIKEEAFIVPLRLAAFECPAANRSCAVY